MDFTTENKYNKSSHATYRCEYHFVWVPKYRYKVLVDDVKPELRNILTELCEWLGIIIIEGFICDDHVHMYLSVPPKHSPSYVMKILKGKSSELLRKRHSMFRKRMLKWNMWARGYFVTTVGLDKEIVKKYVRNQEKDQMKQEQLRLWRDV